MVNEIGSTKPVKEENLTPGMRQYMNVKQSHPDCIVMFRMGDFYEMFYQDAKTAAKELDITLTSRGKGEKKAPLAGIPYHSVQPYIGKLISKGHKVCIVEQAEDPKKAKGLVKREVLRIVTPGTVIDETILDNKTNNYIMAINKEKQHISLALSDISTGEFIVLLTDEKRVENELNKYMPSEVILPLSLENSEFSKTLSSFFVNYVDDLHFFDEKARQTLDTQFEAYPSLDPFLTSSAGALVHYLHNTQKSTLDHIRKIKVVNSEDFMLIDKITLQNLNIMSNKKDDKATLLSILDKVKTSMGSRLLRKWMLKPLLDVEEINKRLESVEELKNNIMLKEEVELILSNIQDLERLIARIVFKTALPKDLVALRATLKEIPKLNKLLQESKTGLISTQITANKLLEFNELVGLLDRAIKDQPNTSVREGNIIRKGYNEELDELRKVKSDSKSWLLNFEAEEKRKTGIKFLRVKYNKVFGYFIEVSKSNINLVPDSYIRKQTQVNCERYITPELKEKENIILTVDEKINELEYNLFMDLIEKISKYTTEIQDLSDRIAIIDVIACFASVALVNNYTRPTVNDGSSEGNNGRGDDDRRSDIGGGFGIEIVAGRHPIVEKLEQDFVSNDLRISEKNRMMIITGPNMAGKSVYIKQNALIVLMAQIGSFVPAKSARIGIVDRIFSRVGASDDIASGHSTFMVEMNETANILANATDKSFIILDEIGRGTSTYDGVSLAWAIAEYIIKHIGAKTLFATHYHHLNKMAEQFDNIENYNIAVLEREDEIVFLRKIVEGGTDKSYGIQVAKIAGVPKEVIETSKRIINQLEMEDEIGDMIHKDLKNNHVNIKHDDKKQGNDNNGNINRQKTLLDL